MPKRSSKKLDVVQNARRVVLESVGETEPEVVEVPEEKPTVSKSLVSKVMAEMGRKGGRIGGKRRMETMTGEQRRSVARRAARARWKKAKDLKKVT